MHEVDARSGNIVQVTVLEEHPDLMCGPEYVASRKLGVLGQIVRVNTVEGRVTIWVRHGQTMAPYYNYELKLIGQKIR